MAKGQLKVIAYSQDNKMKLDEGTLLLVNNEIADDRHRPAQGRHSPITSTGCGRDSW